MADKMYKTQYSVDVADLGGSHTTFSDQNYPGAGTAAYEALRNREDICSRVAEEGDTDIHFIPFASVAYAIITMTRTEVDKPADDTCVEA